MVLLQLIKTNSRIIMNIRLMLILALASLSFNGHGQTIELAYFKNNQGVQNSQIIKAAQDMQSTISQ